jgi:hypothetical protein
MWRKRMVYSPLQSVPNISPSISTPLANDVLEARGSSCSSLCTVALELYDLNEK